MPRGLPISTVVDIDTQIAAGGVLRTEFGTGVIVTVDPALPAGGPSKMQVFADHDAVIATGVSADVVSDSGVWFSRNGAQSLYLGRWAPSDVSTSLRGGMPEAISQLTIANAGFSVGGVDILVDLSGVATYAAIATAIANALTSGQVASVSIGAGGTGYAAATTTVAFAGGSPARAATGTVVIESGVVTAIIITDPGSGYQSVPSVTITDTGSGSGATATATLGAPATILQGATFTYDTDAFLLTLSGAEDIGASFGTPSTGTDISARLGLGAMSGVRYLQGHDAETFSQSISEMIMLASGSTPVALMVGSDAPDSYTIAGTTYDTWEEIAEYAQAGDFVTGVIDSTPQAITTGDTTSRLARVFERQQDKVEPFYTIPGERPDIGGLALLSSQDLNQPASIITLHLKELIGVEPTTINATQLAELIRKRANVYTTIAGLPALHGGYSGKAGNWLDAVWWLLWLKNEMELTIYNGQRASRRYNTAILGDNISQVMRTAVQSGGANLGGRVSANIRQDIIQTTGNSEFNGILPAGYLTWIQQAAARSDLDRENRIGRFKTWIAPADAIHNVYGDIVLSG